MAMPQVHIVAYATDLGFEARDGALMLSLMLGFGIISRLVSVISDFIGGLGTLVPGSTLQGAALVGFLFIDSLEDCTSWPASGCLKAGSCHPTR